uniref:ATPase 10 plasma membrane-type-like n=1 Tax=Rhizophora mucronata TaxID=61149 RepID=A0A2P2JAQ6_RHIMU
MLCPYKFVFFGALAYMGENNQLTLFVEKAFKPKYSQNSTLLVLPCIMCGRKTSF